MRKQPLFAIVKVATLGLSLIFTQGCIFDESGDDGDVTPIDAAMMDAPAPSIDAAVRDAAPTRCSMWTEHRTHFDPCALPEPLDTDTLSLDADGAYTLSTDTGELESPTGQPIEYASAIAGTYWVMSVESLNVASNSSLRVTGSRPLVIAIWDTATIAGLIDVSSSAQRGAGAGSNTECGALAADDGANDNAGGGGGGGGGGGSSGAKGGDGPAAMGSGGAAGNGEIAPVRVRGGCNGGSGGFGANINGIGVGGKGGGAVQITAWMEISVSGSINAGGEGGRGANGQAGARSGGGGGGAGGFVGLEAQTVNVTEDATLTANGGGGGEGMNSLAGEDGQNGKTTEQWALGGLLGSGSAGGNGAALANGQTASPGDDDSFGNTGGGGGGGGTGWIIIRGGNTDVSNDATISPQHSQ